MFYRSYVYSYVYACIYVCAQLPVSVASAYCLLLCNSTEAIDKYEKLAANWAKYKDYTDEDAIIRRGGGLEAITIAIAIF